MSVEYEDTDLGQNYRSENISAKMTLQSTEVLMCQVPRVFWDFWVLPEVGRRGGWLASHHPALPWESYLKEMGT